MDTKTTNLMLREINHIINRYAYNKNLFCGGCCYAAYVLAKNLKVLGINYRVVMFQDNEIVNTKRFSAAINGMGVAHVAIQVKYKNRWAIIGDCDRLYAYFWMSGEKFAVRTYKNISPEQLLAGYRGNCWNPRYDTNCNGAVMRDINRVARKYVENYMNN